MLSIGVPAGSRRQFLRVLGAGTLARRRRLPAGRRGLPEGPAGAAARGSAKSLNR